MKSTITFRQFTIASAASMLVAGCGLLSACGISHSASSPVAASAVLPAGDQPSSSSTTTSVGAFPTPVIYRGADLPAPSQSEPVPLVIALHGGGATAAPFAINTGLEKMADQQGFVVAALGSPLPLWKAPSDITYIGSMITQLTASENIDPQRVYVVGFSLGGYATFRSACELSAQVAAVTIVSSAMAPLSRKPCDTSRPVSELSIVGSNDVFFPVHKTSGKSISADQTAAMWRALDGCSSPSETTQVGPTTQTTWNLCNDGTTVGEYVVDGGTHRWPGSPGSVGADGQYDAAQAVWAFLSQHSLTSATKISAALSSLRVSGGPSRQVRVVLQPLTEASVRVLAMLAGNGHLIASRRFNAVSRGRPVSLVLPVPNRTKRGRYRLKLAFRDVYGRTLTIVRTLSVPAPLKPNPNRRSPSRAAG